jgi:hypothetical protein
MKTLSQPQGSALALAAPSSRNEHSELGALFSSIARNLLRGLQARRVKPLIYVRRSIELASLLEEVILFWTGI